MTRYTGAGVVLALGLVAGSAGAQDVELGGQVRPRFEVRDPVPGPAGTRTAEYTTMRSRLSLEAALGDGVRVFVQLQDVRAWGGELGTTDARADALDLHQGWAELGDGESAPVSVRVGRQELSYGGERLVGALNWAQQARSFDGARLRLRPAGGVVVDAVAMQLGDVDAGTADGALAGLHGRIAAAGLLEGYVWYVGEDGEGDRLEDVADTYTVGARWESAAAGIRWRLEGAYQLGESRRAAGGGLDPEPRDVSAYLVAGRVGAQVSRALRVEAWYDRLSGDDDPGDGEIRVFDTLFATNHKFYGHMDLFLNIPVQTGGRGLQDVAVKGSYAVREDQSLHADLHGFYLAATDGLDSGHIGEELDLAYRWRYAPGVALTGGLSWFAGADAWTDPAALGRADDSMVWGYLMLDVAF